MENSKRRVERFFSVLLFASLTLIPCFSEAGANPFIKTVLVLYVSKIAPQDVPRLARYDVLDLNRFNYDDVNKDTWRSIKAINPAVEIYIYQLGSETAVNQDQYDVIYLNSIARFRNARGHSMGDLDNSHPDLFLHDGSGSRLYNPAYPNTVLMDFGSKSYQKYWIEATMNDLVRRPWKADGIFVDNCLADGSRFGKNPFGSAYPIAYSKPASWNNAMNAFVNLITSALHNEGQKVFTNRGNSRFQPGFDAWIALDELPNPPDLVMEEGAFAVRWGPSDVQFYPEEHWKRQVDIVGRLKNSRIALLSHTDLSPKNTVGTDNYKRPVTFWQALWYSMCSYHLARKDDPINAYFMFETNRYKSIWWFDEYDRINLGRARGRYKTQEVEGTRIYFREFRNGYIFVNPTLKSVVSFPLPVPCVQITHETINVNPSALPVIQAISIPSHHGVVVMKASSFRGGDNRDQVAPALPNPSGLQVR